MTLLSQIEMSALLLLSSLLGSVIGINRERLDKAAGMRTHMLVAMGSTLFTSLGIYAIPNGDASRIGAAVVGGIGFIGGGIIFRGRNGERAKGLTTAASVWATSAIGTAVGTGAWFVAISGTILIWFILEVVNRWEIRAFP